jgi:HPt (histidine-containing phosphotransfer) domain-containing protein
MKSYDFDAALKLCFGKPEMLEEMMNAFRRDSAELLNQMHEAFNQRDLAEAGRVAHQLKGSAAYLGAQPVVESAAALEQAAGAGDMEAAAKSIIEVEAQVDQLRKALVDYSQNLN